MVLTLFAFLLERFARCLLLLTLCLVVLIVLSTPFLALVHPAWRIGYVILSLRLDLGRFLVFLRRGRRCAAEQKTGPDRNSKRDDQHGHVERPKQAGLQTGSCITHY